VVITNYPAGKKEWITAPDFPHIKGSSSRKLPFSNTLYPHTPLLLSFPANVINPTDILKKKISVNTMTQYDLTRRKTNKNKQNKP
jgi:hypothetical protein